RSTECTTSAYLATLGALFVCNWPTKCQVIGKSAQAAALGAASASRFSPKLVTPSSASSLTSAAGHVLVIATSVMSVTPRPHAAHAASILLVTPARLAASSARRPADGLSSLEEVWHIQVVVLFEDHRATAPGAHLEELISRTGAPGVLPARRSGARRAIPGPLVQGAGGIPGLGPEG